MGCIRADGTRIPLPRRACLAWSPKKSSMLASTATSNTGVEVAGLYYDRLWTLLIPLVKDLDTRLSRLEQATTTN